MKRIALPLGAVLALLLSAGTAAAAGGPAVVETVELTFAPLTSETCPNLPDGTSITWSGTGTSITRVRTDGSGVTTVANTTEAHGFASDQDGNTYAFNYNNSFRVSNSTDDPGVFTGTMIDSFALGGNGPAKLSNGFVAELTTDLETFFEFNPLHSRGDPLDFETGTAMCDPL
jgi:hypothetical protein